MPLGTLTEEQAKQRWLARQEAPAWGQGPAAPQYPAPAEPEYPAPDVASQRALALAVTRSRKRGTETPLTLAGRWPTCEGVRASHASSLPAQPPALEASGWGTSTYTVSAIDWDHQLPATLQLDSLTAGI